MLEACPPNMATSTDYEVAGITIRIGGGVLPGTNHCVVSVQYIGGVSFTGYDGLYIEDARVHGVSIGTFNIPSGAKQSVSKTLSYGTPCNEPPVLFNSASCSVAGPYRPDLPIMR